MGPNRLFGKRAAFSPKLGRRGPDLLLLSDGLVFPETDIKYAKKDIFKMSLLARNILRRVICLEGRMVNRYLLPSVLPDCCHFRLLDYVLIAHVFRCFLAHCPRMSL